LPELELNLFGDVEGLPADLEGQVRLLGTLSQREVGRLYRESDILIDMSYWHGFGRMGIESMACGVVPVLSRSGGVDRYAVDGTNCFMFDVGNQRQALEKIILLARDRELRFQMRQAALQSASKFSEQLAVDDWLRILGVGKGIQAQDPLDNFSSCSPREQQAFL